MNRPTLASAFDGRALCRHQPHIHRPTSAAEIRTTAVDLARRGLKAQDIAAALGIHPGEVPNLTRSPPTGRDAP